MERFILPSIYLGAISGVVFGILLLIPYISPFIFFLMFILAGILAVCVIKKSSSVGLLTIYDGLLIGSISGFISIIATSIIYLPIVSIFGGYFSMKGYDLLAILIVVVSTALLSALFNAFSGLVTAYVFEKMDTKYMSFQDHFEIEQGDEEIS